MYVEKAGTLKKLLNVEANLITHLEISGFINGTDLRLIREMAGIDYYGNPTLGQLRELDIAQLLSVRVEQIILNMVVV